MADSPDPKYLDKRIAERYLRSGQLDEKAFERHIKGLPDVAEKAVPIETAMDGEDFDTDEDLDDEESEDGEETPDEDGPTA